MVRCYNMVELVNQAWSNHQSTNNQPKHQGDMLNLQTTYFKIHDPRHRLKNNTLSYTRTIAFAGVNSSNFMKACMVMCLLMETLRDYVKFNTQ